MGMTTRLVVAEFGTGAQFPPVRLARVSRWPAMVGQEISKVFPENCALRRIGTSLYTMPPVPLEGVFVTSAYNSPSASSAKPCTVRPFGKIAEPPNWNNGNALIRPV